MFTWDEAYRHYRGKIHTFATETIRQLPTNYGYTEDDVEQEILEVLWRCLNRYNATHESKARFNTYFWSCAKNRRRDLLRRSATAARTAVIVPMEEWHHPLVLSAEDRAVQREDVDEALRTIQLTK